MARQKQDQETWETAVKQAFESAAFQELLTMATTYYQYYSACRYAGFDDIQAMALTQALQTANLEHAFYQNERNQDG